MSESLNFCIEQHPSITSLEYTEIFNTDEYIKAIFGDDILNKDMYIGETKENGILYKERVNYDPDCKDFKYIISQSYVSDSTLAFLFECISKILNTLMTGSYDKRVGEPRNGDFIKYTIGNFIVIDEYGYDFSPKDKPWLTMKTTVMLPVKMEKMKINEV